MDFKSLLIGSFLFILSQSLAWFQIHAQFFYSQAKDKALVLSLMGFPISYILIQATKYMVAGFNDGSVWPTRLMGFAFGMISMTVLTQFFLGEGLEMKTIISLCLAVMILLVQLIL